MPLYSVNWSCIKIYYISALYTDTHTDGDHYSKNWLGFIKILNHTTNDRNFSRAGTINHVTMPAKYTTSHHWAWTSIRAGTIILCETVICHGLIVDVIILPYMVVQWYNLHNNLETSYRNNLSIARLLLNSLTKSLQKNNWTRNCPVNK